MAELKKFYSDVVLGEVASGDLGYGVYEGTVTWAATMSTGALLKGSDAAGYTWAAAADIADVTAVLVDVRALGYDETLVAATDYDMVVAKRGMTLNLNYLEFSDATGSTAAVVGQLATLGIKATDKVVGNQPA